MSEHGNAAAEGYSLGNGRYVLQRVLGEGGMASVHLAYDSVLDRQVALKSMHAELGRDDSFKERFRREAQAVARLEHPNIVTVYDSGEDIAQDGSSTPYIVMQLIDGKGLRDAINEAVGQHGAMPVEEALRVTIGVLNALEASHDMGLVHRDIKPGNVMFDRKGNVKVMDFGIARALESGVTSMTQTGMVVGTPQYLSPEQGAGQAGGRPLRPLLGRGDALRDDHRSAGLRRRLGLLDRVQARPGGAMRRRPRSTRGSLRRSTGSSRRRCARTRRTASRVRRRCGTRPSG